MSEISDEYDEDFAGVIGEIFSIREANIAMAVALSLILISGGSNVYKWTQE